MRGLLLAVALVLILILIGWITVSFTGNQASVTLEEQKIEQDTRELKESAREFAGDVEERLRPSTQPEPDSEP